MPKSILLISDYGIRFVNKQYTSERILDYAGRLYGSLSLEACYQICS